MYSELLQRQGVYNNNQVNLQFFSSENVDKIQNMIQTSVYKQSGDSFKISRQSDTELFIIMQSIYNQHGLNMNTHIDEQVNDLNQQVTNEATRIIMPRIHQYVGYMDKLTGEMKVLDYGFNTSTYGYDY